MAADLRERLERLAGELPVAAPPDDLWQRGVRRQRRRRAGALVAVVVAVLAVLGGSALGPHPLSRTTPPADAPRGGIPERVVPPDPRSPDTSVAGELGPLAVVLAAPRAGRRADAAAGVEMGEGQSRFLSLVGQSHGDDTVGDAQEVALSPTGRWVAFWGETRVGRRVLANTFVVHDTVKGTNYVNEIRQDGDVSPAVLSWASDTDLVVQATNITRRTGNGFDGTAGRVRVFDAAAGRYRLLPVATTPILTSLSPSPTGFTSIGPDSVFEWRKAPTWRITSRHRVTLPEGQSDLQRQVMSPSGDRLAGLYTTTTADEDHQHLVLGSVPSRRGTIALRDLTLRPSSPIRVDDLLGWQDEKHVIVSGVSGSRRGVFAVDVGSGTVQQRVQVADGLPVPGHGAWADGLWDVEPTSSGRPWVAVAAGVGVAVAAGAGLLLLRRRHGRA